MGMFDSLYIKCPKCGKEMELQSKSGACAMFSYTQKYLPIDVAMGLSDEVWRCEFCDTHWKFHLESPTKAKFRLIKTNKKKDFDGNHNPDHPDSIKEAKEFRKFLEGLDDKPRPKIKIPTRITWIGKSPGKRKWVKK